MTDMLSVGLRIPYLEPTRIHFLPRCPQQESISGPALSEFQVLIMALRLKKHWTVDLSLPELILEAMPRHLRSKLIAMEYHNGTAVPPRPEITMGTVLLNY